jgi:lipopolysaccharide transport system ATP-binding protein
MYYGTTDLMRGFFGLGSSNGKLRAGEFWAVRDVNLTIGRGECVALIGPNGSGKSTLLKMINGIFMPDNGEIRINGRVGALIEVGAGFHPMLTGRENVYVNGAILGMRRREIDSRLDDILDFAEIGDFIDAPVKHYSSGMYVRLGFAVAAQLCPEILLIDEVLAVGDTAFRLKCFNHILKLISQGRSIVLVSHNLSEISRVCERSAVLNHSSLVFDGNVAEGVLYYESLMHEHAIAAKSYHSPVRLMTTRALASPSGGGSGSDIIIQIEYESDIAADDCIVLIKLSSIETGHFSSFTNRVQRRAIPIVLGGGLILVKLPNPPLIGGNYSVEVHLYNSDHTEFWGQQVPACRFDIVEPRPDVWKEFHKIRIDHEWLT